VVSFSPAVEALDEASAAAAADVCPARLVDVAVSANVVVGSDVED